jgi:hypothetical protein
MSFYELQGLFPLPTAIFRDFCKTCLLASGCLLLATGIQPLIYILVFQFSIIKNSKGKKPVVSDQKPLASG